MSEKLRMYLTAKEQNLSKGLQLGKTITKFIAITFLFWKANVLI